MKIRHDFILRVGALILFSAVVVVLCWQYARADTRPFVPSKRSSQAERYENYLDKLVEESERLDAEKSLRALELSLYEEILKKQAELDQLEEKISAAKTVSIKLPKLPAEKIAEQPLVSVPPAEEVKKEFASIIPSSFSPGKNEVLVAVVHLKRNVVREVRVLSEGPDSIYAEVPLGRISIRKSEIEEVEPYLLSEEDYRFKLGDYYDNVPTSRCYYWAIAQYNRVLDINPNNKRAKEKLEKCREELGEILERERKKAREVPERVPQAPEPPARPPAETRESPRRELSHIAPPRLDVFCYHIPVVRDIVGPPHPCWLPGPRWVAPMPPFVPLDVNRSIVLVPFL